jgi:hypothetical protein
MIRNSKIERALSTLEVAVIEFRRSFDKKNILNGLDDTVLAVVEIELMNIASQITSIVDDSIEKLVSIANIECYEVKKHD